MESGSSATRSTRGASPCSARSRRSSRAQRPSRPRTTSGSTSAPTARTRRADRTHGAEGVIPAPLWIVLFLSAAIIFGFMLFFADSAERAVVQATMMGGVAIVITSTLLLLWFLDNPYHAGVGGLQPVAMERTIRILDHEETLGLKLGSRCDEHGELDGENEADVGQCTGANFLAFLNRAGRRFYYDRVHERGLDQRRAHGDPDRRRDLRHRRPRALRGHGGPVGVDSGRRRAPRRPPRTA